MKPPAAKSAKRAAARPAAPSSGAASTAGTRFDFARVLAPLALGLTVIPMLALMNRGLDLTDEGYYLLGYRHPRDVYLALSHFQPLIGSLVGHPAWPVLFFRALGLVLALVSSGFVAIQIHRFGAANAPGVRAQSVSGLAAFTMLGAMLAYSFGPRALSYNGLNNTCMLTELGLTLLLVRPPSDRMARRLAAAAALGVTLAAHFVIKAPAAALMGVWVMLAAAMLGSRTVKDWLAPAFGIGLGAAVCFAAVFGAMVPFHTWWSGITIARAAQSGWYGAGSLLASGLRPLEWQIEAVGVIGWGSLALVAAGAWAERAGRRALALCCIAPGALTLIAWALYAVTWPNLLPIPPDSGVPAAMLLALALTLSRAQRPGGSPRALPEPGRFAPLRLIALLLPLPLLAALGTNNSLTIQIVLHLAPWFACLWLLADWAREGPARWWLHAVRIAAAMVAVIEVGRAQFINPYRIPGGMAAQKVAFSSRIVNGRGMLVDSATVQLVESTRDLLDRNGFRPGDPVIALFDLPGLVYLVGARSPVLPWYLKGSSALVCRAIELSRNDIERGRAFLITRGPLPAEVSESLLGAGFGSDTRMIGVVHSTHFGELRVFERGSGVPR